MKEIKGKIEHRVLLNYRIKASVIKKIIPKDFEPKLINGFAIAGICQVSLSNMHPKFIPSCIGTKSHNAAHRVAVLSKKGEGVFVIRRDTNSIVNEFSSGKLFPGLYRKAKFSVKSEDGKYSVFITDKEDTLMAFEGEIADEIPSSSVFNSKEEVSKFFKNGSLGWSRKKNSPDYDSIELQTEDWSMKPLHVSSHFSAFFNNPALFPEGSVEFDSAMIMKGMDHSWVTREELKSLCC